MVLRRYFYREIGVLCFLCSFSLVLILSLYRGGEILQELSSQGLDLYGFFLLVLFSVPELLELLLPVGLFVGLLMTLQRLRVGKELLVILFSGMSFWRVFSPILLVGLVVGVLTSLLSFYIAPHYRAVSDDVLRAMFEDRWASLVRPGVFVTLTKDIRVYSHSRDDDGSLSGIVIGDGRGEGSGENLIVARRAELVGGEGRLVVKLTGVNLVRDDNFARLDTLSLPLNVETWNYFGSENPTRLSIGEVYGAMSVASDERELTELKIEWHRRLSRFPMVLSLVVVGCLFLLLAKYQRNVSRAPVVWASVSVLFFELVNLFLQKQALDNPADAQQILLILYPLYIIPIIVGGAMIWRASRVKALTL